MILSIGQRVKVMVGSLAEASRVYSQLRDASGEGASTWPDGKVDGYRISYNGRVWEGKKLLMEAAPRLKTADVEVGDRFIHTLVMPYVDGERGSQVHRVKLLIEVTKVERTNASWKRVETLENVNPPSWVRTGCGIENGGFSIIEDVFKKNGMVRVQREAK
jgi:hypothetical protein